MFLRIERDYHPLSLDVWSQDEHGLSSYNIAREFAHAESKIAIREPLERDIAESALLATITDQAARNSSALYRFTHTPGENGTFIHDNKKASDNSYYLKGGATPDQYVAFLQRNPELEAIEIARRTHVGNWAVRKTIDAPVREYLDDNEDIDTMRTSDEPSIYKIKQFCRASDETETMRRARIERKRIVRQHFGGNVLTVVRNMLLVDYTHPDVPDEVRKTIEDSNPFTSEGGQNYDYDEVCDYLHDPLEPHITGRDSNSKPEWVKPLLTTYYTTLKESRERVTTPLTD